MTVTYQIEALPLAPFAPLFPLSDQDLAAAGARRWTATQAGLAPCRVSLKDADAGERLILVNHAHLTDPASPYRASGPIFVREDAVEAAPAVDAVPDMLTRRPLSIRVYDAASMMIQGEVIDGPDLDAALHRWFAEPRVEVVHIHFAPRGCYLARAVRH